MTVKRWNIYRANLDPLVGSEQGKSRPVIIISEDEINNLINTVNIIHITSRNDGRIIYPNEVLIPANNFGLTNESIALCHQIRTIDKKRMAQEYGHISDTNIQIDIIAMNLRLNGTGDDWNKNIMKFSCLSFIT
jgi:mRNA interferase MazF